mmetsp:Transcript_31317/g.43427  ORF Transcript_31317/g.43427 Transcript_31317/m.43427 type:complete len:570 (+) Transcript_31317:288-1997(+)|eukprot:CAMPEP_0196586964 /NCGR_PEP_ID=MMETSP1081-20130531/55993_1 /TAXON_ID=36882 /ORGANISM="Pyramimonas amylifera, Strain CCMP720" /LENGTH=569 /DNA_ID=CAMNT_0041908995 /DNA_START=286 /DNA_END=1995 /DNA_ORIENTATION=-
MEIYYMFTKLRRDFGRHPQFVDEPAEVLADIRPDNNVKQDFIDRNPVITVVQVVPDMSEHEANTEMVEYKNSGMFHLEGGWPKDIDFTEVEHTIRYRKKVEKDEDYIVAIAQLGGQVEELIKQNNAIDIYEEYFQGSQADHSSEQPFAKTLTVFRDPAQAKGVQRSASYISWHPDGARKLAVSYAILDFQQQPEGMPVSSYVWDVNNPNTPETVLTPASQMVCAVYNPKDPNILISGLYNGQLSFWDNRKSTRPIDTSPIECSHRDPVYDIVWLQSKTGTECASVSTDGNTFWWDIRRMREPVESLVLQEKNGNLIHGAVCMEYEAAAGPTKFMVGTEQGSVISCNRKAKNPQDRVGASYSGHHGPVYALERNPFFAKYFCSIGDWTARIWMEDLKTPIMTTKYHDSYLMGGMWSPTRPGVFFTIKMDGTLDVWDYFYKQNDPSLSVQVTDQGLTSVRVQDLGKMTAIGAVDGSVTLLELCDGLSVMQPNEKPAIAQMFERETKREKNLEARQKELRLKAKRAGEKGEELELDNNPETIKIIEKEFFDSIQSKKDMDETNPLEVEIGNM